MRAILFALLAMASTAACTGTQGGGSIIPVRAVGSIAGDSSGPQVFIAGYPINALVKVHGNFTYTVQATPPYVTYDGDWSYIIEPVPQREHEAISAVQRGDILIRKSGRPAALSAPGTIAGYKAAVQAKYAAKPVSTIQHATRAAPVSYVTTTPRRKFTCDSGTCSLSRP